MSGLQSDAAGKTTPLWGGLTYNQTASGGSLYHQLSLAMNFKPSSEFIFSVNLPFRVIDAKDIRYDKITAISGEELYVKSEFDYLNAGLGDASLFGWYNLTRLLFSPPEKKG